MNDILHYDPITGDITWKVNRGYKIKAGQIAGSISVRKYRYIEIDGKNHLAHRLAWYLHYGVWPTKHIDHINGIPDDNRISNLREASRSENQQNRKMSKNNKSGYAGVYWHARDQKWIAKITKNGKRIEIGRFDDKEEARRVREAAKAQLHTFNPVQRIA